MKVMDIMVLDPFKHELKRHASDGDSYPIPLVSVETTTLEHHVAVRIGHFDVVLLLDDDGELRVHCRENRAALTGYSENKSSPDESLYEGAVRFALPARYIEQFNTPADPTLEKVCRPTTKAAEG